MSGGANTERQRRTFSRELEVAFALIGSAPNVGHPYRRSPVAGTRRVLLVRSRYHVYYVPLDDELVVLAVWHASRGSGPPLRLT
jgi:plasmid stabilization system protein ParE